MDNLVVCQSLAPTSDNVAAAATAAADAAVDAAAVNNIDESATIVPAATASTLVAVASSPEKV